MILPTWKKRFEKRVNYGMEALISRFAGLQINNLTFSYYGNPPTSLKWWNRGWGSALPFLQRDSYQIPIHLFLPLQKKAQYDEKKKMSCSATYEFLEIV
jgi:hypothetical protein